jgi:CP family cyanate transporter-like MFS transporter
MSLGLLSDYASDGASAARLTAMAFSVTYTVAAFGPFVAGMVMDTVQSWTLVFLLLTIVTLLQLVTVPFLKHRVTID